MKLVTYRPSDAEARAGCLEEGWIYDLGPSLHILLERGRDALAAARAGSLARWAAPEVEVLAPLPAPRSFRDFYAFEQHVVSCRRKRGLEPVPEWYQFPAFYFSNTSNFLGPGSELAYPPYTAELDYELEVACVIGRQGRDIGPAEADEYIAGFMILNDWSARDVQRAEVKVGLGPAKGKDFATSTGPWLVTPDELADRRTVTEKGARYTLAMTAKVNGQEYSRGNLGALHYTFGEMISRASQGVTLYPGEVIASGTVGTGCLLETGLPWLRPGDLVELEVERLGVLCSRIAVDPQGRGGAQ